MCILGIKLTCEARGQVFMPISVLLHVSPEIKLMWSDFTAKALHAESSHQHIGSGSFSMNIHWEVW